MPTLDLASYEPAPGTSGDANQIKNAFIAIMAAVNGLDGVNFTGTGANGLDPNKLKNFPNDVTKALLGDGSWGSLGSVVTGVKIADLGAGTDGKQGKLRLRPATYNNGGATALPAATLTSGDNTDFPAAGTLETPNGDVAYTGKTATTFTGCTGGSGTLAAGAALVLKTGTPSFSSYDLVGLVYDSTIGKWVSPVISFAMRAIQPSILFAGSYGDVFASQPGTVQSSIGAAGIPHWRAYDAAGLKPQVRIAGFTYAPQATVNGVQFSPGWAGINDTETAVTAIGRDTALATAARNFASATPQFFSLPWWGTIPGGYTLKDTFLPSMQGIATSQGGSGQLNGILDVRWVG